MTVFGLVLAGGEGRRMGGTDKALIRLGGQTLAARLAGRLGPQVAALAIAANGDPARLAGLGLPVLADPPPGGQGPLAGILAGLDWAADGGADWLATVAVDTPFAPLDMVDRLWMADAPLALAESGRRLHPTAGLWPVALRDPLRTALSGGLRRPALFAADHGAVRVRFDGVPDPFFNINTPADLATARAILAGA
ncbi:molybdenum cofactor guanylyltransferase MobA [Rhodovulum adriaticum]|uniref:Molybdenum cofactor guanylyltransferase n=1 Tax=Rhodovulum adriaticum TaxID=35804 RepID=A0A4R2NL86_RHOAD|nr:molybdenum cofactor guanylyltransferase MobA [Rhodovulum adriaticum]MBK1635454.1 molybdenum cofactor guanylyltransferase MobA [Rhodovulum adriaticum]TCP22025.1 molybdenum cofactor guanylyltransferase [Rhodovulum adriaticum]